MLPYYSVSTIQTQHPRIFSVCSFYSSTSVRHYEAAFPRMTSLVLFRHRNTPYYGIYGNNDNYFSPDLEWTPWALWFTTSSEVVKVVNSPPCSWRWCAGRELAGQTGASQTSCTAALGNHRMWVLICTLKDVSPDMQSQMHCPCHLPSKSRVKTNHFFMVTFYIRMAAQSCMEDNFCNKNGSRTTVPSCSVQTRMASLPLTFVPCHHAHCVRQAARPSTSSCILTCFI